MDATLPAVHDSGSSTDVDQSESESRDITSQTPSDQHEESDLQVEEGSTEGESLSGVESLPSSSMEVDSGMCEHFNLQLF